MKLSQLARKMIQYVAIAAAVFIAAGAVLCFVIPALPPGEMTKAELAVQVALGIILSSLINMVKVLLLDRQVSKLGSMSDPVKAKGYASFQAVLRFLLTGAGLVAAHFIPFTNLVGAIAGAFTWHAAAYGLKIGNAELDIAAGPTCQTTTAADSETGDTDAADESSESSE